MNIQSTTPFPMLRIACLGCLLAVAAPAELPVTNPALGLAKANLDFGLILYRELSSTPGNLLFSPHSVSTALAMLEAGARGDTRAEMTRTLRLDLLEGDAHALFQSLQNQLNAQGTSDAARLQIANSLWSQSGHPPLPDYLDLIQKRYQGHAAALNFGQPATAAAEINRWVEDRTLGRIKDLIPPSSLNPLTRLVLVNAIHFKGQWAVPFSTSATRDQEFRLPDRQVARVPFMRRASYYAYAERPEIQALELPYAGGKLSMVLFLPREDSSLERAEQALVRGEFRPLLSGMPKAKVNVELPRYTFRTRLDLNGPLQALGMKKVFSMGDADLSGINGRKDDLYLSRVVHQAFIEVNEEGTEAAAATGAIVATRAVPEEPPLFRADRPFLFVIKDSTTGAVLFLGRVADPR